MINNRKLKSFPKFTSKSSYVFEHMRSAYAHKNKLSCRIIMTCAQRMNCDSLYGLKIIIVFNYKPSSFACQVAKT